MLARNGSHWLIAPVLGISVLLFALFLGGVTGIGWFVPAALLLALPLLLIFAAFFWNQSTQALAKASFWLFFLAFCSLGVVYGVTGVSLNGAWQLCVFLFGFFGCVFAAKKFRNKWLFLSFLFLAAYHLVAILSLVFAPAIEWKSIGYQFVSNLKILALFGFFLLYSRWVGIEVVVRRVAPAIAFLSVVALGLQWGAQSFYAKAFPNFWLLVEETFFFPSSGMAIFHHPSILAGVSAVLGCYYFSSFLENKKWGDLVLLAAFSVLLVASNQRQEALSYIFALAVMYFFLSRQTLFSRASVLMFFGSFFLVVFLFVFWDSILRELTKWGIGTWSKSSIPRYQLYDGALTFAQHYFPLGRGLGSYGGVGAMKFDLMAYYELGLNTMWWWPKYSHYLLDAYWPNALGEGGILGLIFMVAHYLFLLIYFAKKSSEATSKAERHAWFVTIGTFVWILGTTPTSPGFQEILILVFPVAFWVVAEAKSDMRRV